MNRNTRGKENINKPFFSLRVKKASKKKKVEKQKGLFSSN